MSEIKWIKLTTNMFDDEKIKLIESMPEADSILIIWIKLLVQAGKTNAKGYIFLNENIPYTDEMLATIFNRPLNIIRMALDAFRKFGMIEIDENGIFLNNWEKYQNIKGMERIKEQNRLRKRKQREKEKALQEPEKIDSHVTSRDSHATDLEEDIDIDIDLDKDKDIRSNSSSSNPSPTPKKLNIKFTSESRPFKAAAYLRKKILENNSRARVPNENPEDSLMQKWATEMDKLNRIGSPGGSQGYNWDEIRRIIDWCQDDEFWYTNILSPGKLRKQIVTLENQMKRQGGTSSKNVANALRLVEKYSKEEDGYP